MPEPMPGFDDGETRKVAGGILRQAFQGADEARKRWYDQGNEIARYGYAPNFNFEYQSLPASAFFKAKVGLTSEAIRLFGPYLYQQNPHRTLTVRPWASEFTKDSATVLADYLNYSVTEYDAARNARRWIDQAVCWGRGVRWLGRHPQKPDIICSLQDDVRRFYDDGDARIPENRRIIFRERIRPRDEVILEYPEAEKWLRMVPKKESSNSKDAAAWESGNTGDTGSDMICYIEAYAIVGLHRFRSGNALAQRLRANGAEPSDQPGKYLFTKDGLFIHACAWEVPLYIDGEWPVTELDFYDYPDSVWPVSPLEPGIGYQRCINWLVTLIMGRCRRAFRLVAAIADVSGEGLDATQQDQVLIGDDVEMLSLKLSSGRTLKDFLQETNPSFEWLREGMAFLNLIEDKYNKATGKYDILYYGQTGTQSRTATDAQVKDRNSQSRLEDMRDRLVQTETRLARKEALAARYLLDRQAVGRVMGPDAATRWGFLVADQEAKGQFVQQLLANGFQPQEAMMIAEDKFAQAVDLRSWAAETDYGIEADSLKRRDIDQRIDALNTMNNQNAATLLQSPDPRFQALGLALSAAYMDAIGGDQELVRRMKQLSDEVAMTPPAPVAAPAQPAGDPAQPVA